MLRLFAIIASAMLLAVPVSAATVDGQKTYDLLFKNGTLDEISRDDSLVYDREVTNAAKPESGDLNTGQINLTFSKEDETLTDLMFTQGEKFRKLGSFPASVGNPMIMLFYESVVRDMAETAGGSPFYIRNRVKEALIEPSDVEEGEAEFNGKTVPTKTIRLHPFEGDPNIDRMQGFGSLELSVTMSEAAPGWYLSLVAEAKNAETGETVYRSATHLDGQKEAE